MVPITSLSAVIDIASAAIAVPAAKDDGTGNAIRASPGTPKGLLQRVGSYASDDADSPLSATLCFLHLLLLPQTPIAMPSANLYVALSAGLTLAAAHAYPD